MFYTHNKSTFNYNMSIQDHLLRDRPHQGTGISRRMCYFYHYGQAGVNRKATGILN